MNHAWYTGWLLRLAHHLPPETAHRLAIHALSWQILPAVQCPSIPTLEVEWLGQRLRHPIGLAAGFDKDACCIAAMFHQGFAATEVGTITPEPQRGNKRPRLYRLTEDQALINRMGFNNEGLLAAQKRLRRYHASLQGTEAAPGLVGVNIGCNKTSPDPMQDYKVMLEGVYDLADYIVVNISSPNTPGLRSMQDPEPLQRLTGSLAEMRQRLQARHGTHRYVPILVKVAPDLTEASIAAMCPVLEQSGMDSIIVGNTTLHEREGLKNIHAKETGGLSGRPLFERSSWALYRFYQHTNGRIPLIGVGGIASAEDVYLKCCAGASWVQIYTALIYQGAAILPTWCLQLQQMLQAQGGTSLSALRGSLDENALRTRLAERAERVRYTLSTPVG